MPLVIAVLAIIVFVSWATNSSKEANKQKQHDELCIRRTNANLEQRLVDFYMKHGISFDNAYRMAQRDIIDGGYEPCIPRSAYRLDDISFSSSNSSTFMTSHVVNIDQYESYDVKRLREEFYKTGSNPLPGMTWDEWRYKIDLYVYSRLARNPIERQVMIKKSLKMSKLKLIPVGELMYHELYGTCEVIEFTELPIVEMSFYKVRVLKTGEETQILANDKRILKK